MSCFRALKLKQFEHLKIFFAYATQLIQILSKKYFKTEVVTESKIINHIDNFKAKVNELWAFFLQ